MKQAINEHKRMAMGGNARGYKAGGSVGNPVLKTGTPQTPITKAKSANGVPGMKKGGSTC